MAEEEIKKYLSDVDFKLIVEATQTLSTQYSSSISNVNRLGESVAKFEELSRNSNNDWSSIMFANRCPEIGDNLWFESHNEPVRTQLADVTVFVDPESSITPGLMLYDGEIVINDNIDLFVSKLSEGAEMHAKELHKEIIAQIENLVL